MWLYYEDKGKYIGMTTSKHNLLKSFLSKAIESDEIISFESKVKLPNFDYAQKIKVMFDVPSFMHKINLDCLNCDKIHENRSCCGGSPFPFDINYIKDLILNGTLIDYVRDEFKDNLIKCRDEKTVKYIYSYNKGTFIPNENSDGIVECPLRSYDRCGIHRYYLDQGLPYYTKPCTWLYPLDYVIEVDKNLKVKTVFCFMLCERTSNITRWGNTSYERHCLDDNLNDKIEDGEVYYHQYKCDKEHYFKSNDYKCAYKMYGSEIEYLFGKDILSKAIKSFEKLERKYDYD